MNMMRRYTRFAPFVALLLLSMRLGVSPAHDLQFPSQSEAAGLVATNQFAALESRFDAIQSAYKAGEISDVDLRAAFRAFYTPDPQLESHYRAWTAQSSKSYVAHLARGIYFKKLGQELLGDQRFSATSGEQRAAIEQAFELARQELNASLLLDDKPLLSYLHLINICQFLGDQRGARSLIGRAVAIDPHNYVVRENYMVVLETQHGGSSAEMKAYLDECRRSGLSTDHLNALEALVVEDAAWVHSNVEGDIDAAIQDYEKAARLDPASSCLPCGPVMKSAELLLEAGNYADAIEQYSQVLTFDANYLPARDGRAFAELQLEQPTLAVEDFTFCANRGDAYAQDMLGRMYLLGTSIPQDRDKAISWLEKAAAQGYKPAINLLPRALDKSATPLALPGGLRL